MRAGTSLGSYFKKGGRKGKGNSKVNINRNPTADRKPTCTILLTGILLLLFRYGPRTKILNPGTHLRGRNKHTKTQHKTVLAAPSPIQTFTVGSGIAPDQPQSGSRALPPVR